MTGAGIPSPARGWCHRGHGTGRYDVIPALDTLILISGLADVVAGLHAALRPKIG